MIRVASHTPSSMDRARLIIMPAIGIALTLLPLSSLAQVGLRCTLEHTLVLELEPIKGSLTLHNETGQELELSSLGTSCRIGYTVMDASGMQIYEDRGDWMKNPVLLPPTASIALTNDLVRIYDLRKSGAYTVQARADWSGKIFLSDKIYLDIVPGMELERIVAGVPGQSGQTRTYSLRSLNREKRDYLFLRIDDEDAGICYGVFDLGRIVQMGQPTMKVDGEGRIHVLHQSSPGQYLHTVMSPDGDAIERKIYAGDYSMISMKAEEDGSVVVTGSSPEAKQAPSIPEPLPMRKYRDKP